MCWPSWKHCVMLLTTCNIDAVLWWKLIFYYWQACDDVRETFMMSVMIVAGVSIIKTGSEPCVRQCDLAQALPADWAEACLDTPSRYCVGMTWTTFCSSVYEHLSAFCPPNVAAFKWEAGNCQANGSMEELMGETYVTKLPSLLVYYCVIVRPWSSGR